MDIAILVYPNVTALDFVGPNEVLARLPDTEVKIVSTHDRLNADTGNLHFESTAAPFDIDSADVLLVPGGPGTLSVLQQGDLLGWIRDVHATTTRTTSVCTGSLILGAAGLLEGRRATTHWSQLDALEEFGARPRRQRIVRDEGIITAAGVSAGIDLALELVADLHSEKLARACQLGIEYDPDPPFDAGNPDRVEESVRELALRLFVEP